LIHHHIIFLSVEVGLESIKQQNLIITPENEPEITVDNVEVAQFVYLLLHNEKIRDVIDTITSKAVLILGRFTEDRKAVLDALREELRQRNYLPVLFDFEKPHSRNTDETITLLARMARVTLTWQHFSQDHSPPKIRRLCPKTEPASNVVPLCAG
jgi:hypothetical protein